MAFTKLRINSLLNTSLSLSPLPALTQLTSKPCLQLVWEATGAPGDSSWVLPGRQRGLPPPSRCSTHTLYIQFALQAHGHPVSWPRNLLHFNWSFTTASNTFWPLSHPNQASLTLKFRGGACRKLWRCLSWSPPSTVCPGCATTAESVTSGCLCPNPTNSKSFSAALHQSEGGKNWFLRVRPAHYPPLHFNPVQKSNQHLC